MTAAHVIANSQLAEARLLLRFASGRLTDQERSALAFLADGVPTRDAAKLQGNITDGGIWMAQQSGLRKMRQRLRSIGIRSVEQIL